MKIWYFTAYYDFVQYIRMKVVVIIMFGLPLLLIFLLGSAFSGGMKPVKIAVYNADKGAMQSSVQAFMNDPALTATAVFKSTHSETEILNGVKNGSADYGIVIPADFSEQALAGRDAYMNSYPGRGDMENRFAEALMNRFLSVIQTKQTIEAVMGGSGGTTTSTSQSEASSSRVEEAIVLAELVGGSSSAFGEVSAIQYYAGSYLIMFLLYSGMPAALSLLDEKRRGTLGRLYSLPQRWSLIIAGRITSITIFAAIQSLTIIVFSWLVFGVEWGNRLGQLALVCLLASLSAVGLSLVIASIVKTEKATQSVFSIIVLLMTFLSGGMVPDLGDTVLNVGKFTVNHWAVTTIRQMMDGGADILVWKGIGILAGITVLLLTIALLRMKKVVGMDA
ncbi:ABC transporter permease [Paenibacillus nasutitermitis]|uniref:Transport permease YfiM n=1 Tax=Paenibacillus nasutitermitis TaxID=1652958 RepID=A0A916Z0Q5_9BACL|nr:ABC transporter permease [Paenibacillus nasutitermitis]GGD70451.1 putative transport permease YfiM [Paenibacillus nasutitermitis]